MKKITFLLLAILLMSGMAMAQQRERRGGNRDNQNADPKEMAEKRTERMAKEYSLNDTQKKELLAANLAFAEKQSARPKTPKESKGAKRGGKKSIEKKDAINEIEKAEKPSDAERQQMRTEMEASRKAYDEQVKKIMTKDQYAAYTKNQANREQKPKQKERKAAKAD